MATLDPSKVQWDLGFTFADGRMVVAIQNGPPVRYKLGTWSAGHIDRSGPWLSAAEVHKIPGATGPQYEVEILDDGREVTRKHEGVDP